MFLRKLRIVLIFRYDRFYIRNRTFQGVEMSKMLKGKTINYYKYITKYFFFFFKRGKGRKI